MSAISELPVPTHRWDLSCLFDSLEDPKIAETWIRVNRDAESFEANFRGKINSPSLTSETLLQAITRLESLSMDLAKPITYGHLRFSVEANDPAIGGFLQSQMEQASTARVKLIFFEIELQQLDDVVYQQVISSPSLADYRHFCDRVRQNKPYTLSEAQEQILEETANTGVRAWTRLHDEILTHHKFQYLNPTTGETEDLTESETLDLLRHADRQVRINAGNALSAGLEQLNHVLTYLYNVLLQDKRVGDRLRNRPYPEHSRHMENELEQETVDLVMRLCKEYEGLVARYYRVKKSIMGLDELLHVDRYAPLFESKKTVSYDDAKDIVLSSFGRFSPTVSARAKEFFDCNWIDAEPRDGKTGGAFCSYITPDTHPVIMLSYLNKLDDLMTLAHELGHGVHGSLSRAQSYFNFDGSLPLAELASIFGEQLVFESIISDCDDSEKLALYAQKIEGIFATVFRQAAMFRFEQRCHVKRRDEGELTSDEFGDIWQDELQGMFGDSVTMGEQHRNWWSYVGHFIFAPFYVYAYSFGELLTMSLYEKARVEGPSFEAKYIELLTLGGSRSPKDLMAIVGVDLNDEKFWRGGFEVIEKMIETFESLWAKR